MQFGHYLKNKRTDLGWTQPDAAAKIGIEQSYLSKLETGKSVPSDEIFNKLKQVYSIDLTDMTESVLPSDLIKLNEVESIKATVFKLEKKRLSATRSWLVAGLVLLILGGSLFGATLIPDTFSGEYKYRSQGTLEVGEDLTTFSDKNIYPGFRSEISDQQRQRLIQRIDQKDKVFDSDRGSSFLEKDSDGLRYYELLHKQVVSSPYCPNWLIIPAIGFILGGLGCFFIGFMWRQSRTLK